MLTNSLSPQTLRIVLLAIAATVMLTVLPATAGAAAKSCVPSNAKTVWRDGSVRVYGVPVSKTRRGEKTSDAHIYACSPKYARAFRLEPGSEDSEQASISDFHWNGRFLVYTREIFAGASSSFVLRMLDLKTGRTTRKGPSLQLRGWPAKVDCGVNSWGCLALKTIVRIGPERTFFAIWGSKYQSADGAWHARYSLARVCVNQPFTSYTATLIDDTLTESDTKTLVVFKEATWTSGGQERRTGFC